MTWTDDMWPDEPTDDITGDGASIATEWLCSLFGPMCGYWWMKVRGECGVWLGGRRERALRAPVQEALF